MSAPEMDKMKSFQVIPGVGPSLAKDLVDLGFQDVLDLAGRDPEMMYDDLCDLRQTEIDPCVLCVFRCAVYYASHEDPDADLLKWWNWKDRN